MVASKVLSEEELKAILIEKGFKPVIQTKTSSIWQKDNPGISIQVPESIQGFYPDWLLYKLEATLGFQFPR